MNDYRIINEKCPLKRWHNAHHLFFVVVQGLILCHQKLYHSIKHNEQENIKSMLHLATNFFKTSVSIFRYGTDYLADEYEHIVRPSMENGFSDIYSLEHTKLLQLMKSNQALLKGLSADFESDHKQYVAAIENLYDNHALVCSHFVGSNTPSLMQAITEDPEDSLSAPEILRKKYKKRTLSFVS